MAHDAELAQRVRQALGDREVREVTMFGGLHRVSGGAMLAAASLVLVG